MFEPNAVHVVVDLETVGTTPGSAILQIGAVAFAIDEAALFLDLRDTRFDEKLSLSESICAGFSVDEKTRQWWRDTNNELFTSLVAAGEQGLPIPLTLDNFSAYLDRLRNKYKAEVYVWGNGPEFDLGLLACYYNSCMLSVPWDFRKVHSLRTLKSLYPAAYGFAKTLFTNPRPHNGYFDAVWEAQVIRHILSQITQEPCNG